MYLAKVVATLQLPQLDYYLNQYSDIQGLKFITAPSKHILDNKYCKNHSFLAGCCHSYVKGHTVLLKI